MNTTLALLLPPSNVRGVAGRPGAQVEPSGGFDAIIDTVMATSADRTDHANNDRGDPPAEAPVPGMPAGPARTDAATLVNPAGQCHATNPTDWTNSANPTNSANAANPINPINPVNAANAVNPTNPTNAVNAANSSDPFSAANSTDPITLANAAKEAYSITLADPTNAATFSDAAYPVDAVDPLDAFDALDAPETGDGPSDGGPHSTVGSRSARRGDRSTAADAPDDAGNVVTLSMPSFVAPTIHPDERASAFDEHATPSLADPTIPAAALANVTPPRHPTDGGSMISIGGTLPIDAAAAPSPLAPGPSVAGAIDTETSALPADRGVDWLRPSIDATTDAWTSATALRTPEKPNYAVLKLAVPNNALPNKNALPDARVDGDAPATRRVADAQNGTRLTDPSIPTSEESGPTAWSRRFEAPVTGAARTTRGDNSDRRDDDPVIAGIDSAEATEQLGIGIETVRRTAPELLTNGVEALAAIEEITNGVQALAAIEEITNGIEALASIDEITNGIEAAHINVANAPDGQQPGAIAASAPVPVPTTRPSTRPSTLPSTLPSTVPNGRDRLPADSRSVTDTEASSTRVSVANPDEARSSGAANNGRGVGATGEVMRMELTGSVPIAAIQPAPVPTLARTAGSMPATSASPTERAAVAEQLVAVVRPLTDGDGTHSLTVDLHPMDLGRVRLEITVEGTTVHIAMHAEHGATSALLHESLPELHRSLDEAGLRAGRIALGADSSPSGGRSPQQGQTGNQATFFGGQNPNRRGVGDLWPAGSPASPPFRAPPPSAASSASATSSDLARRSIDIVL